MWMNAMKKLLGGMSLNGQAIPVGGINKGTTGMPVRLFSIGVTMGVVVIHLFKIAQCAVRGTQYNRVFYF